MQGQCWFGPLCQTLSNAFSSCIEESNIGRPLLASIDLYYEFQGA